MARPISAGRPVRGALRCMAAATSGKIHEGAAFLHVLENTKSSPVFGEFLEGLFHVTEVARSHPGYLTTMVHQAYDDERAVEKQPFAYFTLGAYAPMEGGTQALFAGNDDFLASLEFGVPEPQHALMVDEVATLTTVGQSPLAPGPLAECPEERVVVLSVFEVGGEFGSEEDWAQWTGAQGLSDKPGFLSATLYKTAGLVEKYQYAMRAELEAMEVFSAEAMAADLTGSTPAAHVGVYKSLFSVPKEGLPTGVISATRDKEMIEKMGAAQAEAAQAGDMLIDLENQLQDEEE